MTVAAGDGSTDIQYAKTSALLRQLFDAAVTSALPENCIPSALPSLPKGRTIVVGAGKASAAMARVVEQNWDGPIEGLVITRHGHAVPCERIEVAEAGHPVPDDAGVVATRKMIAHLDGLTKDDLVIFLISGGASSLLTAPPPGVSLSEIQTLTGQLLRSGGTIKQMNCVRKHLSMVAGGKLTGHARPAKLVTLAISDVPGDDPATIGSGPTVVDHTTRHEALETLKMLGIQPSPAILKWLEREESEAFLSKDDVSEYKIIASPQKALQAAAEAAKQAGHSSLILGSAIEGEAREIAKMHAAIATQVKLYGQPIAAPCILLSGGETSVAVRGNGRGGRNSEFLLSLANALDGEPGIYALAADTDGIDGTEENAGALIGPDILSKARTMGLSSADALENSDSCSFFDALGALVVTGPTYTNVNDFRAIFIDTTPDTRT